MESLAAAMNLSRPVGCPDIGADVAVMPVRDYFAMDIYGLH